MNESEKDQLLNDILNDEAEITLNTKKVLSEHLKFKVGLATNAFKEPIKKFTKFYLNRTRTGLIFPEKTVNEMMLGLTNPNAETDLRTGNPDLDEAVESCFQVMLKYVSVSRIQQKFIDFLENENQNLKLKLREENATRRKKRRKKTA